MADKQYPRELDEAQKLFWSKMWESAKNTTKTRIYQELQEIKDATKKSGSILKTWASMIKQGAKDLRD